jgi:hypothetical protein
MMREMFIGDFINPEEQKEPWEDYVKRKAREEQAQLAIWQKLVLVAIFLGVFFSLYSFLTKNSPVTNTAFKGQ